ncbi:MAG: T9SS type A sorting domain-containing protein, partial [Chitinophagales bacterium]
NDFELKYPSNTENWDWVDFNTYRNSFNVYGIISNNSTIGGGRIYSNNFGISNIAKQLNVGNQTEEDNLFLEILCNEYNTKVFRGWYVNPEEGNLQILDRLANQGSGCYEANPSNNPAGNLFYANCPTNETDIKVGYLDPIPWSQPNDKLIYWGTGGYGNDGYPCATPAFVEVNAGCDNDNYTEYCEGADLEPVVLTWTNNNTPFEVAGLIEGSNYTLLEQSQLTFTALSIYEQKGEKNNAITLVNALSSDHALDLSMKYHLSLDETSLAQNKLNEMAVRNVYDSEYIGFYQLLINVKTSNRNYHELTPIEVQSVENIASSYSYAAVNAQALLAMLNETPYDRIPMLGTGHSQKKETVEDEGLQLYPNPMGNSFTIHIEQNNTDLLIYDIRGVLLKSMVIHQGKQTIDLELPSGTYFLSLEDNISTRTKKIIVAH